jgi:hypothetical protein
LQRFVYAMVERRVNAPSPFVPNNRDRRRADAIERSS